MRVLWGIGGAIVLLAIAFAPSTNPRAVSPRAVIGALATQPALVVPYRDLAAGPSANLPNAAVAGMLVG